MSTNPYPVYPGPAAHLQEQNVSEDQQAQLHHEPRSGRYYDPIRGTVRQHPYRLPVESYATRCAGRSDARRYPEPYSPRLAARISEARHYPETVHPPRRQTPQSPPPSARVAARFLRNAQHAYNVNPLHSRRQAQQQPSPRTRTSNTPTDPPPTYDSLYVSAPKPSAERPPSYALPRYHEPRFRRVYRAYQPAFLDLFEGRHLTWPALRQRFPSATGMILVLCNDPPNRCNGGIAGFVRVTVDLKARDTYDCKFLERGMMVECMEDGRIMVVTQHDNVDWSSEDETMLGFFGTPDFSDSETLVDEDFEELVTDDDGDEEEEEEEGEEIERVDERLGKFEERLGRVKVRVWPDVVDLTHGDD